MEKAVTVKFKWNALKSLDEGGLLKACGLIEFYTEILLRGLYFLTSLKKSNRNLSCALKTWPVKEVPTGSPLTVPQGKEKPCSCDKRWGKKHVSWYLKVK